MSRSSPVVRARTRPQRRGDLPLAVLLYVVSIVAGLGTAAWIAVFYPVFTLDCTGGRCHEYWVWCGIAISWCGAAVALIGAAIMLGVAARRNWPAWIWPSLGLVLIYSTFQLGWSIAERAGS